MAITEAFIFTAIYEPLWRLLPLGGLFGSGDHLWKGTEQRGCDLPKVIISLTKLCLLPLLRLAVHVIHHTSAVERGLVVAINDGTKSLVLASPSSFWKA